MRDTKERLAARITRALEREGVQAGARIEAGIKEALRGYDVYTAKDRSRIGLGSAINAYLTAKKAEGLSGQTIEGYRKRLTLLEKRVGKAAGRVTADDIRGYIAYLSDERKVKRTTMATEINIIRAFFRWLDEEGLIKANPCLRIKNVKVAKDGHRKALSSEEMKRLRAACRTVRERLIVELFFSTGCRLSEITGMDETDIDIAGRSATVTGKGNKQRTVYFNTAAADLAREHLNGRAGGALFLSETQPGKRLGNRGMQRAVERLGERAGIVPLYPHLLRHTFATTAVNAGMDAIVLQRLLGHEDMNTTMIYAEMSEDKIKRAYMKWCVRH